MGKNKAKTAASVAAEAKPEVEIWRHPKQEAQLKQGLADRTAKTAVSVAI